MPAKTNEPISLPAATTSPSPRRKPGCGFTLEVQQLLDEELGWSSVVKALARCCVVGADDVEELPVGEFGEIGFARQEAAHASDGIFDATFLPGGMRVAEEGRDVEIVEFVVLGELGAIVDGDGLVERSWKATEKRGHAADDRRRGLAPWPGGDDCPRLALVQGENCLALPCEEDEVGFPMSRGTAVGGGWWPLGDGNAVLDKACRTAASLAAKAAPALGAGQVEAPAAVVGAGDLGVDEAIDRLVADDPSAGITGEAAGDLLRRPAALEAVEHAIAQALIALQARSRPTSGLCLLIGVARLVADLSTAVALQLARDRRWLAIQSCRDLPDRAPIGLKPGNLAPVLQ